jgi:hypothetical protein
MIEDRIGELRLRVRTDLTDAAEVRSPAERIARAVLDRCAAQLEARAPGRVVLVRHLPLHWQLDESVLSDDVQLDELASWTADAIERIAVPSSLDAPATREGAVMFEDESHLRASHLLALARGGPAWFHAALEDPAAGDPLATLAEPEHRIMAQATLARLAAGGVLAEVLAAHRGSASATLSKALGCKASSQSPGRFQSENPIERSEAFTELAAIASQWPTLAPSARSLALRAHAAVSLHTEWDAPEAVALAAAVADHDDSWRVGFSQGFRPDAIGSEPHASIADRAVPDVTGDHSNAVAAPEKSPEFVFTRCAGLFFLLDRVMELDLAESLWQACLPEGAVLKAAAAALLGPSFDGDAAPALFGGIDTMVICPEVAPEQHAEVATTTLANLAAALTRRGLAEIPPIRVALVDHPSGKLLVASDENSPFACFAWPATSRQMLTEGLRVLLGGWPQGGALIAAPALACLDGTGRLLASLDSPSSELFLPEASSAPAAALLMLVAGAPCLLFAARADAPVQDTTQAFVAQYLARSARVRLATESMDVLFESDYVDLNVRRAGLDRDPGWLPWLRRTVRFEFKVRELSGGDLR